jgi:PAS domain S-box-containing protein
MAADVADSLKFAALASVMPVGILRTHLENRCSYISERVTDLIGLTAESALESGWEQCIHPDDREAVRRQVSSAIQVKQPWAGEFRCVLPDGRIRWLLGQATPEQDVQGSVVGFVWALTDTTHVHEALQGVQELSERLLRDEARQAFLLKLADALRPLSNPLDVQEVSSKLLGEHLGVNRVGYAELENREYVIRREYARGVAPLAGQRLGSIAAALRDAFRRGETVVVEDVDTDPRFTDAERVAMRARQIAAFVGVMLLKDGQLVGAFGVNNATPRSWAPVEIALIRDVAERTWDAVERARAEAALREREQRLRLALDASAGGSWTWEPGSNHIDWDDGFRARYGFTPEEPPTHDGWMSRVYEEDLPQVLSLIGEILNSPGKDTWDNSFRIVLPDGTVSWIRSLGRADRAADGQVTRITGLDLDVTARRRAEEALLARRDEERDRELQLLLETATQGIVVVDAQAKIVTANRALGAMFGWAPGELIGQSIERLVPSAVRDAHAQHWSEYFTAPARPTGVNAELSGQRKDGSTFPLEVSLNHVADAAGGHAIAFVTDITERKRAAVALQDRTIELEHRTAQLSRLASDLTLAEQHAREQLARTLHDGLQQLLVGAALNLERHLTREEQRGASPDELLVRAKGHLDQASAAARSLSLELFPPALHLSGLPAALTWLANRTRNQYGLVVQVSADPLANSDRKDVRTLLFESVRELVFNAVKHAQVDRVTIDLSLDQDNALCITVADQGIGFDPGALAERGKAGKAGWGLFSIRERLTLLGGRFDIESAPGQGTRFVLVAPRGQAQGSTEAPLQLSRVATGPAFDGTAGFAPARPIRILIVDDHAEVRRAFGELLQERPELQVVGEAADGLEAIAAARELRPDVILMDVSMPRMDGVDATRRIHAELPGIQILGLSTHVKIEDLHSIELAGAAGFFTKGVDTQRLIDHLVAVHAMSALESPGQPA